MGRGLGIVPGVGSAFVSLVAYLAVQLAIYGFFGGVMAGQMNDKLGIDWPWWVWTLIAWAVVLVLSGCSASTSGAKVLGVCMVVEIAVAVLLAVVVLTKGGPQGSDLGARSRPPPSSSGLHRRRRDRPGVRLRVVHRLRGDRHLRRGVAATQAHRPPCDLSRGHGHHRAVRADELRHRHGSGPRRRRRRGREALHRGRHQRWPNPAAVVFGLADQYVGSWLAER